jgi:foldase protein PrsA
MRKLFWSALVVLFAAGLLFLSFNSSKTLATSKAGKVTEEQFYSSMKESNSGRQLFANMVINKVLDHEYSKEVTDDDVNSAVEEQKTMFGDSFNTMLQQSNLTEKQFKENTKNNLLVEAAIKDKYKVSDKQLEAAYKDYHADTQIQVVVTDSTENAQKAIDELDNGAKFADVVEKYTTDDTKKADDGKLPTFTSTDTTVDDAVKDAAWKLDKNAYTTKPVEGADGNFYVVKLLDEKKKGDLKSVEADLKEQIVTEFMNNSESTTEIQGIIGQILRDNDVSIKDNDLQEALNAYLTAGIDASSSSSKK